jgi:hypothetical protein
MAAEAEPTTNNDKARGWKRKIVTLKIQADVHVDAADHKHFGEEECQSLASELRTGAVSAIQDAFKRIKLSPTMKEHMRVKSNGNFNIHFTSSTETSTWARQENTM